MTLKNAPVIPTLAVTDLDRAKRFYGDILGLRAVGRMTPAEAPADIVFELGGGNHLCVYLRPEPSGSTATACSFEVNDVEAEVKALQAKGVTFEDYDLPEMGLRTKNGIATMGPMKNAWFKDPDGNILAIGNGFTVLRGDTKGRPVAKHA